MTFLDILGVLLLTVLVFTICFFVWKDMQRSAQYHRKRMMMLDEVHRWFARENDEH